MASLPNSHRTIFPRVSKVHLPQRRSVFCLLSCVFCLLSSVFYNVLRGVLYFDAAPHCLCLVLASLQIPLIPLGAPFFILQACEVICADVASYSMAPENLDDYSIVVLSLNSDVDSRKPAMSPAVTPAKSNIPSFAKSGRTSHISLDYSGEFDDSTSVSGFGMHSHHGTRHGKLNQDDAFCEKVSTDYGDVIVAAVFDGHGILGETAAQAATAKLREIINTPSKMSTPLYDAEGWMELVFVQLQQSVEEAHRDVPKEYIYPGPPGSTAVEYKLENVGGRFGKAYKCQNESRPVAPIDFGTTAALAIVVGQLITVGFLGDAGVIACSRDTGSPVGELVSVPHTASEEAEIVRIETDFPGKSFCTPDGYLAPLDDDLGQYEVQLTRRYAPI